MTRIDNWFPSWRPEVRFLLRYLDVAATVETSTQDDVSAYETLDWEYIIAMASSHGVLPLFCNSFLRAPRDGLPDEIMRKLDHDYKLVTRRNFVFTHELLRIIDIMKRNNIGVTPYKGPFLGAIAYGDPSLRQYSDLDVMVKRKDLIQAKELLEKEGYAARFVYARHPMQDITARQTEAYLKNCHEFEMEREDGLLIDLHWEFAPKRYPYRLAVEPMWERLQNFELEGTAISGFSSEDLLLILCMHGAKDSWKKLIWIIDLHKLITSQPSLDWDYVFHTAKQAKIWLPLLLGLRLASDFFATPLPTQVTRELDRNNLIADLGNQVALALFQQGQKKRHWSSVSRLTLALCEGWSSKASYIWQAFFVPHVSEWALIQLPTGLYPLYSVIRPIRIGLKGIKTLYNRLLSQV